MKKTIPPPPILYTHFLLVSVHSNIITVHKSADINSIMMFVYMYISTYP